MSDGKRNALNWFEIPSANFERAKKFYETILDSPMHASNMGEYQMAFFPMDDGKVGGAVINHPMLKPSADGLIVYLNANPDLTATLDRVGKAGVDQHVVVDQEGRGAVAGGDRSGTAQYADLHEVVASCVGAPRPRHAQRLPATAQEAMVYRRLSRRKPRMPRTAPAAGAARRPSKPA